MLLYHHGKAICYSKNCENFCGKLFAEFVEKDFIEIFKNSYKPTGNAFVEVGDPSQTSKAAKTALDKIGAVQFSITPRSLDLNPIENALNLVEEKLVSDGYKYSISKESYAKLWKELKTHFLATP